MAEPIPPALTPEEWAEWRAKWPADSTEGLTRGQAYLTGIRPDPSGDLVIDQWPDDEAPDDFVTVAVPPHARHKLAALALHGQPFGFSRVDVDALHVAALALLAASTNSVMSDVKEAQRLIHAGLALLNITMRVEALIPFPAVETSGSEP